jgi:hypothetical protein
MSSAYSMGGKMKLKENLVAKLNVGEYMTK